LGAATNQPGSVLIAEPEDADRRLIVDVVRHLGLDVIAVADGGAALSQLNARPFDLLVTALETPTIDGMLLLESIRSAGKDTDVLMVSGEGTIGAAVQAVKMGAVDFLEKPLHDGELRHQIEEVFRQRQKRGPARRRYSPNETTIGRYVVKRRLGIGGFGQVFEAYDPALERNVAVKVIDLSEAYDSGFPEEFIERFRREAHVIARVTHPNLVGVYDFGEDRHRNALYIAMEFVDAPSLRAVLDDVGRMPPARALKIAYQVLDGLEWIHQRGVVHRDLKPTNVLVGAADHTKLLDFGVAGVPESVITNPGVMVGSVHYMSPDMLRGDPLDYRLDQFGVGILLFEMLAGRRLFDGRDFDETAKQILERPVPLLRDVGARVPRRLQKLVSRLLAAHPGERWTDERELLEEVAAVGRKLDLNLQPAVPR
jgi:CheY-like chemotaxis protein